MSVVPCSNSPGGVPVPWLEQGRAKSGPGTVLNLPLPSGTSDVTIYQTNKGKAESGTNWVHRGPVQPGILEVFELLLNK